MNVQLTAEAERDIEAIGDFIAADSPRHARRFLATLREKCSDLGHFPHRFPLVPRYEHLGVRRRVHGDHLIFYRVEPDTVIILHILHGAMDYEPILFPQ